MSAVAEANRKRNLPRFKLLKETTGCFACGRCNIAAEFLEPHHIDPNSKSGNLAHLLSHGWRRVVSEVHGLERDKAYRGGPVAFVCQRYHQEITRGNPSPLTCRDDEMAGVDEPYRVITREQATKNKSGGMS